MQATSLPWCPTVCPRIRVVLQTARTVGNQRAMPTPGNCCLFISATTACQHSCLPQCVNITDAVDRLEKSLPLLAMQIRTTSFRAAVIDSLRHRMHKPGSHCSGGVGHVLAVALHTRLIANTLLWRTLACDNLAAAVPHSVSSANPDCM